MKHKNTRRGFTLIELLVVVLIIGILAAVAVPQYQFAVHKSKLTPYIAQLKTIMHLQQLYKIENGEFSPDPQQLDIIGFTQCTGPCWDLSCPNGISLNVATNQVSGSCAFNDGENTDELAFFYCSNGSSPCRTTNNKDLQLILNLNSGTFGCTYYTTLGKKLCQWLKS